VRRHFNNAEAVGFFPHLRHGCSPTFYGWVLYRFSVTTPLRQSSMLRMSAHSSRTLHSPFSIRCEDVIRRRHRRMARVPALRALSVRRKGVGCRIIVKLGVGPRGISEASQIQHGEPRRLVMSAPTPLRQDFDAPQVRGLARKTKDGPQARRLLALAAIYDGATRT